MLLFCWRALKNILVNKINDGGDDGDDYCDNNCLPQIVKQTGYSRVQARICVVQALNCWCKLCIRHKPCNKERNDDEYDQSITE